MLGSLRSTVAFFVDVARDVLGTFRMRWRRYYRRATNCQQVVVVGVDIFPLLEHKTGIGWYEWHLLSELDKRDDDIEFNLYGHTFLAPDEQAPPEMPGSRHLRLRTHQLPSGFLLPIRPTILALRGVVEPLLRILDNNDLMFAPNFFLARTQLPYTKRLVSTVHDLAFVALPKTVAPETLRELRRFLPDTLFHADRLIAVSDATKHDLVEFLGAQPHRIHTIHEGVDPSFAAMKDEHHAIDQVSGPYLLFVSTLEPRKNVVGVLRCFSHLVKWGYPGSLVLVGRWGWKTEAIVDELANHPARDRIIHLDYINRESLPKLYRNSDALLFPSWLEGFGLPLLEAMICGTPVVTSGQSSMPEIAGSAAIYVDPSRPFGIASAVAALLDDPQHRERLIAAGKKRAAQFSWKNAAAATAQVILQTGGLSANESDEYRV